MRDNLSGMQVVRLGKQTLSGSTPNASAWVDMRDFDACTLVLMNDAVTDAGDANGFTATVQHSNTTAAGDAAAITAAESVTGAISVPVTLDTADNVIAGAVGYVGPRRYVRMNIVGTTGTNAIVEVVAILSKPSQQPTTLIGTSVAAT
jgi:hypothetical protein